MGLSPDAAALKEQALHNADAVLRAQGIDGYQHADGVRIRTALALAYLHGYNDGERMTSDTTIDEAQRYIRSGS